MDVAPPWYELSHEVCAGETRGCSGGDAACRQQAEKDGYVAVSLYSFCRREESTPSRDPEAPPCS
jgi:hypothetical protein